MTDVDRTTVAEARLRESLHRTLVPPPTPPSLAAAVDALAAGYLAEPPRARWTWREAIAGGARGAWAVAGAVAVVSLALVGLLVAVNRASEETVGATPPPAASLPAFTGPALPSPAATPTRIGWAAWLDAETVVAQPVDTWGIHVSTDGGQTWSGLRPYPAMAWDPTAEFTDARHATLLDSVGVEGEAQELRLWATDDAGATWDSRPVATVPSIRGTSRLLDWHFTDADHGIVLATQRKEPLVGTGWGPAMACDGWATDDGGASWAPIEDAPCVWGGTRWATAAAGVAILPDRQVRTTLDGGRTWTRGQLPDRGPDAEFWLRAVVEPEPGVVRLAGMDFVDGGTAPFGLVVLETADGGATWHEAFRTNAIDMLDVPSVTPLSAEHWLAASIVGDMGHESTVLLETVDGGRSWAVAGRTDLDGWSMQWIDRLHGTLGASRMVWHEDGSGTGYITTWLTNDGGRTWHEVPF